MSRFAPYQVDAFITKTLIHNLHIECSSASQVVIKAGSTAGSDDGAVVMSLSSDITVDITNSGANGLDTGSEAANTWYYIYLIWNSSDGSVAGLLSASSTSPTLPSGYTRKRLVGAVRNDSSNDFLKFCQRNEKVSCAKRSSLLTNGSATSYTSLSLTGVVPTTITKSVDYNVWIRTENYSANATNGYLSLNGTDTLVSIDARGDSSAQYKGIATLLTGLLFMSDVLYYMVYDSDDHMDLMVSGYSLML